LEVTNKTSPYNSCNPAESIDVEYYIPGNSISRNPFDRFGNNVDSLVSKNTSEIEIWRNNNIQSCNDWSRISNVVPGDSQLYHVFQNYDDCVFVKPNQPKADDPDRLDAQIHFRI
jgi:hypothetical protein